MNGWVRTILARCAVIYQSLYFASALKDSRFMSFRMELVGVGADWECKICKVRPAEG